MIKDMILIQILLSILPTVLAFLFLGPVAILAVIAGLTCAYDKKKGSIVLAITLVISPPLLWWWWGWL